MRRFIAAVLIAVSVFSQSAWAVDPKADRIKVDDSGFSGNFNTSNCDSVQECLATVDANLVPYTGATADVNLGTRRVYTHGIRADASDGLLLEASNGTDVGVLGAANTTNVTWYGNHNFENQQANSVPYFGSSKTLLSLVKSFFDSVLNRIDIWLNEASNIVTNGDFASASGWTAPTGWSIASGKAQHNSNGTGTLTRSVTIVNGYRYRMTYDVLDYTAGTVTFSAGGNTFTARSANGSYTEYFVATNSATLVVTPTNTARFSVDNITIQQLSAGELRIGSLYSNDLTIGSNTSNSTPGTTRHISLKNAGSSTYLDAYFGNNLTGALGFNSSGIMSYFAQAGTHYFYGGTLTSPTLYHYFSTSGMFSYYLVAGNSGLVAGNTSASQPSKLSVWGRAGFKHQLIRENTTLTNDYTYVDVDADAASSCSGAITYACSHWANQTDCELRDSHGGCTWNALNCGDYSYESGMGTCIANGCTASESNCSDSGWTDQTTCEAADDSYGGNCTYNNNPIDCTTYNPTDQMTCEGNGCSYYDPSCSSYNGDETSCTNNGCYYDSGSTNCYGYCSGTIDNYSCDGTYYTGECSGSGGTCTGTSSCGGINDSSSCGGEAGCSWTAGAAITMPSHSSFSTNFWATYFIRNIGATATATILPNTDQTVNGTTSLSLAAKNWVHLSFAFHQVACSTWGNTNSSTCQTGHTGCTWTSCSGLDEENCGLAGGNCSWDSMGSTCTGVGNCDGTWNVIRDWAIYGKS